MFKKILLLLLLPALLFGEVSLGGIDRNDLVIKNRVLLKINGEPLTVVDVVKKMDLIFYRQYPKMVNSVMAKYEFYMSNFQYVFFTLVNDLLVMADAAEKEVEVSDGDIREEMEGLFGPDVVANIDQLGLTFEEAWKLLKRELTVRRMNQMMVRSKAISEVQPKELKVLYEEYLKQNPTENIWVYHILTFKGNDKEKVQDVAEKAFSQITENKINPNEASIIFKEIADIEFSLSDEFVRKEREISKAHKEVLDKLAPQVYSRPVVQANQRQGNFTARIFFLKEQKKNTPATFAEIQNELEQEVLQKAMARHSEIYSQKLRERYGITNEYLSKMIPRDFQPFALR